MTRLLKIEVSATTTLEKKASRFRIKIDERLCEVLSNEAMRICIDGLDLGLMCRAGRKLRPILSLLIVDAAAKNEEEALDASVGIELIHNSTLIFDDMIDKTPTRRGFPTVHEICGQGTSISIGLFLASKGMDMISRYDNLGMQRSLSQALLELSEGEMLDASARKKITKSNYLAVAKLKSGSLFGLSSAVGAIIAGCTRHDIDSLWRYGVLLGMAYQIYDDLRDSDPMILVDSKLSIESLSDITSANALLNCWTGSSETANSEELADSFRRRMLQFLVSEAKQKLVGLVSSDISDCMNRFADCFTSL